MNGALSSLKYWLNSSVSSEGITTTKKSLFSHIFLWGSSLFYVLNEWRQIKQ